MKYTKMHSDKKLSILITKGENEAEGFDELYSKACLIFFPTITFESLDIERKILEKKYDYLLFTSKNSVKNFYKYFEFINSPGLKVVAVGPGTLKVCNDLKLNVDFIPDEFSSNGLKKLFETISIKGKVLLPCSSLVKKEKYSFLEDLGFELILVPIYKASTNFNIASAKISEVKNKKPDIFVFTSPSSYIGYLEIMQIEEEEKYFDGTKIIVMGTTTKEAIKKRIEHDIILPEEFSLNGIKKCLNKVIKNGV